MKVFFVLAALGMAYGQDCSHKVSRTPVGPVLVYQNGLLLRLGIDYTSAGSMPTITPLLYSAGDAFSVVFSRAVPLSFVASGQTVSYWGYQTWQELWSCATGVVLPPSDQMIHCESGAIAGSSFVSLTIFAFFTPFSYNSALFMNLPPVTVLFW